MNEQENEPRNLLAKLADLFHHTRASAVVAAVSASAPLLVKFVGEDSSVHLEIIIVAVSAYFALNVITDRLLHKVLDVEISAISVTVRLMRLSLEQRKAAAK